MKTWEEAGVHPVVSRDKSSYTGAAYIFVEEGTGNNAIIVSPGAAATISPADMDAQAALIGKAKVFVTQLEQPLDAAVRALEIARNGGAATVLNPAPAQHLDQSVFALCDYVTPNETETEILTGLPVTNVDEAKVAAARLLELGVKTRSSRSAKRARSITAPPKACWCRLQGRTGEGNDRRGRCLQWRFRGGAVEGHEPARGGALRLGGGRDFGDAGRDGAVDAESCRGRGAAGAGVGLNRAPCYIWR